MERTATEVQGSAVVNARDLSEVDEAAIRMARVLVAGLQHHCLEVGRQQHLPPTHMRPGG